MSNIYIDEKNLKLTSEMNFVCLRHKATGRIENVSITESGLE